MSSLIAIVYPSEQKAEEVRGLVFDLAKRYLIKFNDLVIATRDDKGRVKLNQLMNTTAAGAAGGSFWGLLIGLIFLNPLLGVVAGAAGGAISGALTDAGINDKFMKELGASLQPGHAALFVLVQDMTADKVLERSRCMAASCCTRRSTRHERRCCATRSLPSRRQSPSSDRNTAAARPDSTGLGLPPIGQRPQCASRASRTNVGEDGDAARASPDTVHCLPVMRDV